MRFLPAEPSACLNTPACGLLPLLLLTLFCTCGRAPQSASRTEVVGSIRYEESGQLLTANLAISPVPGAATPSLQGNAMPAFPAIGPGHYRGRRNQPFPNPLSLTVPCGEGITPCNLSLPFSPPFIDSLPATSQTGNPLSFTTGNNALLKNENLVFFFEPADRSEPRRILLQGPTFSGRVNLPKEAMSDIPPGKYEVYLIKQQLYKDSLQHLQTSIQTEYFTRPAAFEMKDSITE